MTKKPRYWEQMILLLLKHKPTNPAYFIMMLRENDHDTLNALSDDLTDYLDEELN